MFFMHLFNKKIKEQKEKIDELLSEINLYKSFLSTDDTCCVCMISPKTYANVYCGHLCCCSVCQKKLHNTCPICKKKGPFMRIYL